MATKLKVKDRVRDRWHTEVQGVVVKVNTRSVYVDVEGRGLPGGFHLIGGLLRYDHTHANQFLVKL